MINQSIRITIAIAFGFALLMGWKGVETLSLINQKIEVQNEVTEGVHRWSQSYMALRQVLEKWESSYRQDDSIPDLVSLYAMIGISGYGLQVNTDNVIVSKVDPVIENGLHIGLTKICLVSVKGGDRGALSVSARNYETLFDGINKLADRPDVYIGNISIKGGGATAEASLGEFCVLLRTSQA